MNISDVASWAAPAGRLWAVRPTAAAAAAIAQSVADDGPPSFLQSDHLDAYRRTVAEGREHRAWTGVASTVSGAFDPEAWVAALADVLAVHEIHRCWFDLAVDETGSPLPPIRRRLALSADELIPLLEVVPVEDDPDRDIHERLDAVLQTTCTPDSWPGFGLALIEGDGETGFMWACDHAFTDAASQMMLAPDLGGRYVARRDGLEHEVPARASFWDSVLPERERAAAADPHGPEISRWREILTARGGVLPTFPLPLGLAPGETAPVTIWQTELAVGPDLQALEAAVKAAGARLPSAVVAACAAAEYRLLGCDNYLGVTVLGTRDQGGDFSTTQGWLCNFAPLFVDLAGINTVNDLLPRAEHAFAEARVLSQVPVHAALFHLIGEGVLDPASLGSPQLMSYLDVRWLPGGQTAGGAREAHDRGMHFTAEGRTRNASSWFNRSAERLWVGIQVPNTPEAMASVQTYYGVVREVMQGLARGENVTLAAPAGVTA